MAVPGLSGTQYADLMQTSLHGRSLGLQFLSSGQSGGSRGSQAYLVGPAGLRQDATTADTTATNLHPFGMSLLAEGSSDVFTLDPPVPGVIKIIAASTAGPAYVKTANNETFVTSGGSSFTTIQLSSLGASILLAGLTTAVWAAMNVSTAAGHTLSTST